MEFKKRLEKQKVRDLWRKELGQTPYVRAAICLASIFVIWLLGAGRIPRLFFWGSGGYGLFCLATFYFRYRKRFPGGVVFWWTLGYSVDTVYAGFLVALTGGALSPLAPLLAGNLLRSLAYYPRPRLLGLIFGVHLAAYVSSCFAATGTGFLAQPQFWFVLFLLAGTGVTLFYVVRHHDEIELSKMRLAGERAEMEHLAHTDGLTGVYNYRYFRRRLAEEIKKAAASGDQVSLILFDLDFFKAYTDTFGHQAGDWVLRKVTSILRQGLPSGDVLCRYGGDEFVIILAGTGKEDALKIAHRLQESLVSYPFPGRQRLPQGKISASFGVATFPEDALTSYGLVEAADRRLYEAKAQTYRESYRS